MKMWNRKARCRGALWLALSVIVLALAGCESSKSDAAGNNYGAKDPNHPELFTLRPEQMSHVQVVTVQTTTLTRTLRLTGAVAGSTGWIKIASFGPNPEPDRMSCGSSWGAGGAAMNTSEASADAAPRRLVRALESEGPFP